MSQLKLAMPTIFLHEGFYSFNRKDPGGATQYGISLRFLMQTGDLDKDGWLDGDINRDGVIDIKDIKKMTEEEATRLYDLYWWSKFGYENINDQAVATKIFDLAVNMGDVPAHKCVQRAVRSALGDILIDDGKLGAKSIAAINRANPEKLLCALKSEAAGKYRSIKLKNGNESEFIKGWLNRAYSDASS